MKRIIIGLCATVLALGAHAAAVNWHFAMTAQDQNYEDLAGTVTLYFNDALLGTATMENGEASGDYEIDDGGGTIKAVAEVTNFADGAGTLEYSYVLAALPEDPTAAALVLSDANTSIEQAVTKDYTIDTDASVADNGYSPVGPTPPVIPEPTTGLLVLLGIAGLALKRKQA